MKEIEFNVQEPYKSYILNWQKKIEWRLNKWKFKDIQVWDNLVFPSGERFIVTKLNTFPTFKSMIEMWWIENIIPNAKNIKEAEDAYYQFYTKEQENEFWVIWIYIW